MIAGLEIVTEPICFKERGSDYCQGPDSYMTEKIGATACAYCVRSMSVERRENEYLANHDDLTGLPNRRLLRTFFNQQVATGLPFGAIGIDLKNFGNVNTSVDHDFGDQLLVSVASFLKDQTRKRDTVAARRGGDEFALLANLTTHTKAATSPRQRLVLMGRRLRSEFRAFEPVV